MSYGIIPDYKSESILCQAACKHSDCKVMREDFITDNKCYICEKELKIGEAFCYDSDKGKYAKVHFRCL